MVNPDLGSGDEELSIAVRIGQGFRSIAQSGTLSVRDGQVRLVDGSRVIAAALATETFAEPVRFPLHGARLWIERIGSPSMLRSGLCGGSG